MLHGTLTVTLIPTLRPASTLALLLYDCDYTEPYTIPYIVVCLLLFYKINAATARLLTSVKPAETLARDWPNTNERREIVTSTITLLSIIYRRNIKLTWYNSLWLWRWLPHRLSTTTVLFRTMFTRTIKLNLLLKWLLGSNLSQF